MERKELLQKSIWSKKEAREYSYLTPYQLTKIYKNCQHPYFPNMVYRDKFLKEIGTSFEKEAKIYEEKNSN